MFRSKGNRRRVDVAKKTGELKAAATTHAPLALKILVSGLLTATLIWGAVEGWQWACTSPFFALTQIRFHGNSRATDLELQRLASLYEGQNLVSMNVSQIEKAMGSHPWVQQLTVKRRWHSLIDVEVVENVPVAVMSMGELYLVSEDGRPFKRMQVADAADLPLVTGIDREAMIAEPELNTERLKQALHLIAAYQQSDVSKGHALSEVHVDVDTISLVTTTGQEILLGDDAIESKLSRLAKVRKELQARSLTAEVIRLDNRVRPEWVTVQLTQSGAEKPAKAGK